MFRLLGLAGCALASALLLLSFAPAHAEPPKELYNKSIVLSWAAGYNWKDTDGNGGKLVMHTASGNSGMACSVKDGNVFGA